MVFLFSFNFVSFDHYPPSAWPVAPANNYPVFSFYGIYCFRFYVLVKSSSRRVELCPKLNKKERVSWTQALIAPCFPFVDAM